VGRSFTLPSLTFRVLALFPVGMNKPKDDGTRFAMELHLKKAKGDEEKDSKGYTVLFAFVLTASPGSTTRSAPEPWWGTGGCSYVDGSTHGSFHGFEFTDAEFDDEFKGFRNCATATLRCYMRLYDRCGVRGWGPNADELLAREAAAKKSGKHVRSTVARKARRESSVDSGEVVRARRGKKRRLDSPPGRDNSAVSVALPVPPFTGALCNVSPEQRRAAILRSFSLS